VLIWNSQSANSLESHKDWIKDIDEVTGSNLKFPIIADPERKVAYLYDMVDYDDTTNVDSKGICSLLSWCNA
jgi:glutaredoxin/glutathione-dependent peroxiredoxin